MGQVVWQEGLNHCFNMGRKHCSFQCFGASCLARKLEPLLQHGSKTLQLTVFWSKFLGQESLNHCFNMGRKDCNFQCFGASCLARRFEPLLQHGWKTLYFTVFCSLFVWHKFTICREVEKTLCFAAFFDFGAWSMYKGFVLLCIL